MAGSFRQAWTGFAALALAAASLAGCGTSSTGHTAVASKCGTLPVPADRATGAGPTIPVRVVVIPAAGATRQPDPIVWFAGGPGDSAVDTIGRVRPLFASVTDRDLVFVEQCGTGASNVTCRLLPGLDDKTALDNAVATCLHGLNVDLRFYSTAAFTDDVDQG
jgi:hypothetical protein